MVMASAVSPSPFVIPPTVCSVHVSPVTTFSRLSAGPSSLRRLAFAASISDLHFTAFVAETSRSGCSVGRSAGSIVSMAKRSVGDLTRVDLKGKKVFLRADLNVPLDDDHNVIDDTRIRASLPTIRHLIENGSKVILASHLGRPKGVTPKLSLAPVVPRLSELLGIEVKKADDCIGPVVQNLVDGLSEGSVLLLENLRFYKEEEKNEGRFAKKLASLADVYVNDAFGCVHRAHASTEGITKFLKPRVSGFLLQKELDYLVDAVSNPKRPLTAVIGGSKVSTKIGVIESLLKKCDLLILGGGMVYTFYRALEISVGTSVVEEGKVGFAKSLLHKAKDKGIPILLPTDFVVANRFSPDADTKIVGAHSIPDDWMGLDIGPESIDMFCGALESSQTVIWNGPMGVFEYEKFAAGTQSIARKLAEITSRGATTIVGGGESVAALRKSGVAASITHVSTGGGASLELLEGKKLPGLLALDDRV